MQKGFTVDFLTKKKKRNNGEIAQYYIEGNHEPIISAEIFDMVQEEFYRRKSANPTLKTVELFSGKIICGHCGKPFLPKIRYSTNNYRKAVWRCESAENGACSSPHLIDEEIKLIFIKTVNKTRAQNEQIFEFDEELWRENFAKITVFDKQKICVNLASGEEIWVEI